MGTWQLILHPFSINRGTRAVGGGFCGASLALELRKRMARVVVLATARFHYRRDCQVAGRAG